MTIERGHVLLAFTSEILRCRDRRTYQDVWVVAGPTLNPNPQASAWGYTELYHFVSGLLYTGKKHHSG